MNKNFEIGIGYYNGDDGYPEDVETSVVYFEFALSERCYEAAYYLGLCYLEGLPAKKRNEKKGIEYMEIADFHYVNDATEYLADYHRNSDIEKFFDYALDVPSFLNKNSSFMIKRLTKYYDSVDKEDYLILFDVIELFEFWWKRIKDKASELCKKIAKYRNELLETLCGLLVGFATDDSIKTEIVGFLSKYDSNTKLTFIKESIHVANYLNCQQKIHLCRSIEELNPLLETVNTFSGRSKQDLLSLYEYKKVALVIKMSSFNDEDCKLIKNYYHDNSESYFINYIDNIALLRVEKLLSDKNTELANKLYDVLPFTRNVKYKILSEIKKIEEQEQEVVAIKEPPTDRFKKLENMYHKTLSQLDFNNCFDVGWELGRYTDLLNLMVFAKQHNASFDYVQSKYRESFFKIIIGNLPSSFFADDVKAIKKEIEKRGIKQLIHFSPSENVNSILNNGLLSRDEIKKRGLSSSITDTNRYDGFLNYISLSITEKNYKTLWYKIYNNVINNGAEIFIINPAILYEHPESVIYCTCNASKSYSVENMNYGIKGLRSMFDNEETNKPFDVQAEVLFKCKIDKDYIISHYIEVRGRYGKENSVYFDRRKCF